jgi:Redoxin
MRRRVFFRCFFSIALAIAFGEVHAATPPDFGTDLHGQPIRDLAGPGVRIVVFFFAATDCPISNRYIPEIKRLTQKYGPKGVRFWWVYPNANDTIKAVADHNRDFGVTGDTILDPKQSLVDRSHVTVTPEAAVFLVEDGALREVYHGRIDDRYLDIGQERPQPQRFDLETAVFAALAGETVPQPEGPPVGCSIAFLPK